MVGAKDKKDALYHIKRVNEILDKYPFQSCFANTVTTISRAKSYAKDAEEWISYLHTHITENQLLDCNIKLQKDCNRDCKSCICRDCEDRFECDGGNPVMGCGM